MKSHLGPVLLLLFALLPGRARDAAGETITLAGKHIQLQFNELLHSQVLAVWDGRELPLGGITASETIEADLHEYRDFQLTGRSESETRDSLGQGKQSQLTGIAGPLEKTLRITFYDDFPGVAVFEVTYKNTGRHSLLVSHWTNNAYAVDRLAQDPAPTFWSYQSGSYENRPDWVLPLKVGFSQQNFQGMNASDYGGGTPVVDIWTRKAGLSVGHLELAPKLVSLPVERPRKNRATLAIRYSREQLLPAGGSLRTFRTFASVHQGDYFAALKTYREMMVRQGVVLPVAPAQAFEPIWCAWGYGREFTPGQVYGTLPMVKKLGFGWVTLDDGYQTAEGDWLLDRKKFPQGDRDLQAMTDRIHAEGFKAQLWWAPLAVDPATELIASHPEQLLLNADGSRQKITWWDSWYLCPADPAVVDYHRALVVKIMRDWGFDGLKLDGQFMNGAPPCYNPAHRHSSPEESTEAIPTFFKMIYDTARSIKPDALVEFCPCGTAYSFFTMPFMNMSVASDPSSSWQVRLKGKTLKALAGDAVAYFGDHVDMSDGGNDFASTVGIGGVVGTNFTWPPDSSKKNKLALTPAKEKIWSKWLRIYKDRMLSKGEYLGTLYDIGFDKPEAHAIRKDSKLYYAFYAAEWNGPVELRGLENRSYLVTDYENRRDLGRIQGPKASLPATFQKHLLLEARPE